MWTDSVDLGGAQCCKILAQSRAQFPGPASMQLFCPTQRRVDPHPLGGEHDARSARTPFRSNSMSEVKDRTRTDQNTMIVSEASWPPEPFTLTQRVRN